MIKEIKYSGFTATPSDYECPDGELDAAINFVPEDGELKPVQKGENIDELGTGEEVLLVHVVNDGKKHLIIKQGSSLYYREFNASGKTLIDTFDVDTFKCSATGNVLSVYGIGEMKHYLYKGGEYISYDSTQYDVSILFGIGDCQEVSKTTSEIAHLFEGQQGSETQYEWSSVISDESFSRTATNWVDITLATPLEANATYRIEIKNAHVSTTYVKLGYCTNASDDRASSYSQPPYFYITNPYIFTPTHSVGKIRLFFYRYEDGRQFTNASFNATVSIDKAISSSQTPTSGKTMTDNTTAINAVIGCANELVSEQTSANKFTLPFFVRYGFRLMDETILTVSPPILIEPNTGVAPIIEAKNPHQPSNPNTDGYDYLATLKARMYSGKLKYRVRDKGKLEYLIGNGYIMSLVIAVSEPIFQYKQGATAKEIELQSQISDTIPSNKCYAIDEIKTTTAEATQVGDNDSVYIILPTKDKPYDELLGRVGTFKIIKEIDKDDIVLDDDFNEVALGSGTLSGLEGITSIMPDNVESLSAYDSASVMSYNLREHLINVSENLYCGFDLDAMCGYVGGNAKDTNYKVGVLLDDSGEVKYAVRGKREESSLNRRWFYFPSKYATEVKIYEGSTGYVQYGLTPHSKLKGSYYFDDGNVSNWGTISLNDTSGGVDMPRQFVSESKRNYIYVSEQGNPIVIDQKLRVGDGILFAAAANTKPISRGQMGVAPLFVFASDGIWSLELIGSGEHAGEYAAKQTATRDVLKNIESITPIDSAVLFSTDRGIMLLAEADNGSICLTDRIFSDSEFKLITQSLTDDVDLLPHLDRLLNARDTSNNLLYPSVTTASGIVPFKKFLPTARMLYDYVHQRIIVYNPSKSYAYIYSLKSKQWGMMDSNIKYGINSYPECLAVDGANKIVNLSAVPEPTAGQAIPSVNGLVITRPLKLEAPDILKTIDTIIQRGQFRKGSVQTILYGSRDLFHWQLVYSSQDHYLRGFSGTPYKYYRIVLLTNMQKDESIFGCTIQFNPRLLDQPR